MAGFELRKLQEKEIQILDEIDRICKKYNIQYYLMWGTLLGAVRHKGFIPWDDDIDIAMDRKEYKKFLKIAPKELKEEYFLQTSFTDKWHPMFFAKVRLNNTAFYAQSDRNIKKHHGIFVDIFPMDCRSSKKSLKNKIGEKISTHIFQRIERKKVTCFRGLKILSTTFLAYFRDLFLKGKGDKYICDGCLLDKQLFLKSENIVFEGKEYLAPHKAHEVLQTIYGDYMQLPPENERIAHKPAFISFNLAEDGRKLEEYLSSFNKGLVK